MNFRSALISFLLLFLFFPGHSQELYYISGKIVDSKTHAPMAFVNIVINNSNFGGTTDIDGKFRLKTSQKIRTLECSYVGYRTLTYQVGNKTSGLILELEQKEIDLREVEILPGINPAHRIIRNTIENRDINDPEKVKSFSYTSYDKTIFTVDSDTTIKEDFSALVDTSMIKQLKGMDANLTPPGDSLKIDSATIDSASKIIDRLIGKQYLFLMENVTKRKFMAPDKNYNKVIATKMSGFKDPILVFLATQIQSFSFYHPFITIFQRDYVNPIGAGSLSKYFYKLEDTTYTGKDTVYIISFRPKKGTNFEGLKGVIAINTNHWAIQNVTAEPYSGDGGLVIRINQLYEFIDNRQWFPIQLNTDVSFNNLRIGKYKAVGSGRSYIRDIVLNPDLVRREFSSIDIDVDKDATIRDEAYWNQYRVDSLTPKDRETYKVLDSVGKANNFDKASKTLLALISGRLPLGPIDLDIARFIGYSTYEGIVLGIGLHTNDRLSTWFKVGGFYQYAFASKTSKFGIDISFLVNRRHDVRIDAGFSQDLFEAGGVRFPNNSETLLDGNFRSLMIKKMDLTRSFDLSFHFRALKFMLFNLTFNHDFKQTGTYDYATQIEGVTLLKNEFIFTEIGAGFKWAYGEKFLQTPKARISLGTNYPVVFFQYTRGIKNFLSGQYDYNKFDLKIRKTFNIKFLGKFSFQFNAGYVDAAIPACNLYYGNASYRLITFFAPFSFATMRMNEFLSDTYLGLYLYHDFGSLLFKPKKWFHPEFAIAQNFGIGWLSNKEKYSYIYGTREMNLGYYESGLLINNIINIKLLNIGIGAFYRWGPYSFDNVGDNFAYKVSIFFPMSKLN
ncbi:MAG: DUF5686 family protein [bacterium]